MQTVSDGGGVVVVVVVVVAVEMVEVGDEVVCVVCEVVMLVFVVVGVVVEVEVVVPREVVVEDVGGSVSDGVGWQVDTCRPCANEARPAGCRLSGLPGGSVPTDNAH
jgi:hypothetical protein